MKKILFMSIIVFFVISGCNNSVKKIEADYFDISFGQSLYEGYNKVDKETVQSLVKAYNQIEYSRKTTQEIDYKKAITIKFIYNDQISGALIIDDKGILQVSDGAENYEIDTNNDIYEKALKIYNDLKTKY